MINTLLTHVPIKMENKEVEVNDNGEEHIRDDNDINSEGDAEEEDDEDDLEEDLDEDDDEDDDEEVDDLASDVLEVEQEVTMLMSSDEEAELEAQRIRFPEKRASRKKSHDSKSSRSTSRNSNTSQTSNATNVSNHTTTNNNSIPANSTKTNKKDLTTATTTKEKRPTTSKNANIAPEKTSETESTTTTTTPPPQRTSPRNRKENNKNLDNLPAAGDLRQVARRQSSNSTCSVASSIGSTESAETESCGNIYVYQQEQKLIFNCEFCDLKYPDLVNLSRHLHDAHQLFHNDNNNAHHHHQSDEDQEKENSPRNLRNRNNRLPTTKTPQLQALRVKKEPLQTAESSASPTVALTLDVVTEHSLQSCGNVFILNHRKLFLVCGHCESKYANVELFEKHLRQQHELFKDQPACNEVNVIPKTEIKEEVFIITEVVEKTPVIAQEAMVAIPAEIPLDISTTEEAINEHNVEESEETVILSSDIPMDTEVISSIQIHDSGVTVAEIPVIIATAEDTVTIEEIPSPSPIPQETIQETAALEQIPEKVAKETETVGSPPPTKKSSRKRRSSPEKPATPKSPYKRPRRSVRAPVAELESQKPKEATKSARKPANNIKKENKKSPKNNETQAETSTDIASTAESIPVQEPTPKSPETNNSTTKRSKKSAAGAAEGPKRKRKTIKTKIEKEDQPTPVLFEAPIVPTNTEIESSIGTGPSDRDEEFLEDPVADIIQQIQNEENMAQENLHPIPPTTLAVSPFAPTSSKQVIITVANNPSNQMSPTFTTTTVINHNPNSPEDVKPIINHLGERRYACDQCPRTFKKNVRLVEHKRLHDGVKPFACDECGKTFRIRMQLNTHKLRHSKEKRFICEICQLGCTTKQDLNLHMRHHTNDRRFHCTMCPKAFVRNSDLKIHIRVHTGEKPYVCEICHKCFRANQNLIVHRKSHMGEASRTFQCEHCDKKFLRKIDRTVHMRSHTGEKPFKCEICDRAYSSKFNVRAHIERDHISENGRKKPGPKPHSLREELKIQKRLIEELQKQLMMQIKTDEKIIPAEMQPINESDMEDQHMEEMIGPTTTTATANAVAAAAVENETYIISEISSPPTNNSMDQQSLPQHASPEEGLKVTPFTKAAKQRNVVAASTAKSSNIHLPLVKKDAAAATTTQVVQQKTSLGIQQVSVTVSMQVDNISTPTSVNDTSGGGGSSGSTPEKENSSSPKAVGSSSAGVKKERKITSYFTVVGQKT
uniref:C2H2-type domain-containing protein n=1 Tax=Musca domestica TaxID=7370 RepID=A0A1I8MIN7_MUSDO